MNAPLLARLLDGQTPHASEVSFIADRLFEATTPEVEETAWILALVPHRFDPLVLRTFARTMRARAVPFRETPASRTVDLCGSGGAQRATFNVSTTAAFVVRAAGILVAKHGNRSARGHTGSTDLLEALGLPVADSVEFARESFRRFGLAFLHAPLFHPATRRAASVRRQLGVPTVFNLLGPLTNPARVRCQLVGCADPKSAAVLAQVLPQLGVRRGLTVTGKDGSDEWDPTGTTLVWGWRDGERFR
ncbi:MAG TPA: anthranilate phosphoribosyltransferase, partial [Thermoplasmata archaeon]|nr:anthranilate phosphoribosyltransferase [Thermoplasmata archaeon]